MNFKNCCEQELVSSRWATAAARMSQKYFSSIACEKIPTAYRSYLGKRVSLRFLCKVEPESCFPRDDRDSLLIKKEEIDYSINNNETLVSLRRG